MEKHKLECPKCKGKEVIKWGRRKTENRGFIQRYCCKSCSETFINDSFYHMRNTPQKITCALDLFYRGLSTRDVQSHFSAFFPHNSDHSTILRWIRKFSMKIANFTDNLKVNSGGYVELDEMEYHRRKSHKKKSNIDKNWLINAIDVKSRFLMNSAYVKNRSRNEIKVFLSDLKDKSEQIKTITTDGLFVYSKIVKKTFGYDNKSGQYKISHKVVNASRGGGFNIWVERLHNTIRQRTQNFRGFHGSIESAYALMKGMQIYYNFVKKHEALHGKTPCEMAIPELKFQSANRWIELINLSQ